MATTNGVIQTSNGNLLRAGDCDFLNDGSFDATTESYRTDVPVPPRIRGNREYNNMHVWDGLAWTTVPNVEVGNRHTITGNTRISLRGPSERTMVITMEATAQINWVDGVEGSTLYVLVKQNSSGGNVLTMRYEGRPVSFNYPPPARQADAEAAIIFRILAKRMINFGGTSVV